MKILSLNTALLSILGGLIDIHKNPAGRAKLIVDKILKMADMPDVICFQEAFDQESKIILKNGLKLYYKHIFSDTRNGKFLVGVNSGLMIFSKYPIIDKTIKTYSLASGDSFLSKKSIMGVRLNVEGENICVFNSHYQAGSSDSKWYFKLVNLFATDFNTNQIRLTQLREAHTEITKFSNGNPSVFVGDFNINAFDDTEFIDPKTQNKIVVNKMIESVFPNSETFNPEINNIIFSIYENKRIDYALALNEIKGESYITPYFTEEESDHKAVIFEQ
jgi:exonuclease III